MSMGETSSGCPECGGQIIEQAGERICDHCGLITGTNRIDPGPEWRTGTEGAQNKRRTGAPLTRARHDRGLSTEIGYTSGADVPSGNPRRIARLRREHNRAQISSKAERNQVYGFTEIRRICGTLGLASDLRERACVVFEQAQDADLFQGRTLEGFAAAAVYVACRTDGVARSRSEVTDVARASRNELRAAFDAINRELGLAIAPADPREYLSRFASRLDLGADVEHRARRFARRLIEDNRCVGRKPGGVAGACLYAAAAEADLGVSQREVAEVADVSPVTLRGVYKLIEAD